MNIAEPVGFGCQAGMYDRAARRRAWQSHQRYENLARSRCVTELWYWSGFFRGFLDRLWIVDYELRNMALNVSVKELIRPDAAGYNTVFLPDGSEEINYFFHSQAVGNLIVGVVVFTQFMIVHS